MAKQTPVQAAYQKPGEKGSNSWGGCASVGLFVVLALFVSTLISADGQGKEDGTQIDNIRSGQAHLPTSSDLPKTPNHVGYSDHLHKTGEEEPLPIIDISKKSDDDSVAATDSDNDDDATEPEDKGIQSKVKKVTQSGGNPASYSGLRAKKGDTEQDMSDLVVVAENGIIRAEEDEVKKEKSILSKAVSAMGSTIYSAVSALFGSSGDSAQVQQIADEIKAEVVKNVTKELEIEADEIREEIVDEIKINVEEGEEEGAPIEEIENEVLAHEGQDIKNVRTRIDEKAEDIQSHLSSRAADIEKDLMEQKLSKKLGYDVKLQVVGDKVQIVPGQQQMPKNKLSGDGNGVPYQPPPSKFFGRSNGN